MRRKAGDTGVDDGQPLTVNWANRYIPAILESCSPVVAGGTVIAETLFGEHNPGGKLTVTFRRVWDRWAELPFQTRFAWQPAKSGPNVVRARHVIGELYPFGFGLSYATFAYSIWKYLRCGSNTQGEYTVKVNVEYGKARGRRGGAAPCAR